MTVRDMLALKKQRRDMRRGRSSREQAKAWRRLMNDWVTRGVDRPRGHVEGLESIREAAPSGAQGDS